VHNRAAMFALGIVALSACDGFQGDTLGDLTRLPEGSPERIRILAPIAPQPSDAVMSIIVERLAYETDAPPPVASRSRCVVVRALGVGEFRDLSPDAGRPTSTSELTFDLDRGALRTLDIVASGSGTMFIAATLRDQKCAGTPDGTSLAESRRTVTFVAGAGSPLLVRDAGALPDAGDDVDAEAP